MFPKGWRLSPRHSTSFGGQLLATFWNVFCQEAQVYLLQKWVMVPWGVMTTLSRLMCAKTGFVFHVPPEIKDNWPAAPHCFTQTNHSLYKWWRGWGETNPSFTPHSCLIQWIDWEKSNISWLADWPVCWHSASLRLDGMPRPWKKLTCDCDSRTKPHESRVTAAVLVLVHTCLWVEPGVPSWVISRTPGRLHTTLSCNGDLTPVLTLLHKTCLSGLVFNIWSGWHSPTVFRILWQFPAVTWGVCYTFAKQGSAVHQLLWDATNVHAGASNTPGSTCNETGSRIFVCKLTFFAACATRHLKNRSGKGKKTEEGSRSLPCGEGSTKSNTAALFPKFPTVEETGGSKITHVCIKRP